VTSAASDIANADEDHQKSNLPEVTHNTTVNGDVIFGGGTGTTHPHSQYFNIRKSQTFHHNRRHPPHRPATTALVRRVPGAIGHKREQNESAPSARSLSMPLRCRGLCRSSTRGQVTPRTVSRGQLSHCSHKGSPGQRTRAHSTPEDHSTSYVHGTWGPELGTMTVGA
jgi:hypothetical protein